MTAGTYHEGVAEPATSGQRLGGVTPMSRPRSDSPLTVGAADAETLQPMSKLTMCKEMVRKEDGRYLISYRFLEPGEEDNAPSMADSENGVIHHEPASLGSDAL